MKCVKGKNMTTKYEKHGALHVNSKGKFVDHLGEVVTLHGMSTHGLSWYPEYVNRDFFEFMKKEWHIDVIRLAMYTAEEDGYCVGDEANKEKLKEVVDRGVRYATELGLYVLIDWHILLDSNPLMHKDEAIAFFDEISKKYASYGNVLYEICNEPNKDCEWQDIKDYANEVIPVIRKNDPYAVILVGTCFWSQRLEYVMDDPLTCDKNLMYVLHFYANTHIELKETLENAAKSGLPVFVSEFGTCSADGAGNHNSEEANLWIALMDKYDISYCMWNISNRDETSASFVPECEKTTGGYKESDLREPMKWYKKVLDDHKA